MEDQPLMKENYVALRRGIFRLLVNFFKKGTYVKFDKGKVEKSLFKGLNLSNQEDINLKQEILEAIDAFKKLRTAGYTKRQG